MNDSGFYKCACENCQGHLEFPAHAAGITTTCPHCGVETKLIAPKAVTAPTRSASPPPPPRPMSEVQAALPPPEAPSAVKLTQVEPAATGSKSKRGLKIIGIGILAVSLIAWFGWRIARGYRKAERAVETVGSTDLKPASVPKGERASPAPIPVPAAPPTSVILAKGAPPARVAGADLQVLNYEIHKAKDGDLQYIVGVVTNHSARQYFNVKLEFALTRQTGTTGDRATDMLRNLPASVGSTFKVNIIGITPVTGATLTKVEGEKE